MNPLYRPMTEEEYAEQWHAEANALNARGDYRWMASQLGGSSVVLEVGCGIGLSTMALTQCGKAVIAIERNEHLAAATLRKLSDKGIAVAHARGPASVQAPAPGAVTVVAGSVFDQSLVKRLPRLDAITCWLIGAEPKAIGQALGREAREVSGSDLAAYRWAIHRRCYQLGRELLQPGAAVHLVDRCLIDGWSSKGLRRIEHAEEHAAQAGGGFAFSADNVLLRRIPEDFGASAINYMFDSAPPDRELIPVLTSLRATRA
jgi:hypothetical protein